MARSLRSLALLLLVASALAGCLDDGSDDGGTGDSMDPGTGDTEEEDEDEDERPLLEDAQTVTMYLTADMGLQYELPAAGHFEQGEFFVDYMQGQIDASALSAVSEPLPNATYIHPEPVGLTIWAESDTPHPPFPGFDAVGGVGFFGSTMGMPLLAFNLVDPVFLPGEPVQYDVTLEFGEFLPLVIPAGERVSLFGGLAAMTSDAAPARILVGGEHASSVTFTMSNLTRDPLEQSSGATTETFGGVIETNQDARPSHEFDVGANATELRVEVRLVGGQESDLDLDLYSGGTHISGSHTPATYESIHLMTPVVDELRGTTLTVEVGHFYPVNAEYEVTVTQR